MYPVTEADNYTLKNRFKIQQKNYLLKRGLPSIS
jgi:hypothetical protein